MKIGCFALIEAFNPMQQQFQAIRNMGIKYADLTDNHNGGMLGAEYGFTASVSLDSHPQKIRKMVENAEITLTSICAHANLLDPASPDRYGTMEIIKAIRLAKLLDIKHVITTEGDPKTAFGSKLTSRQQIFMICEKLYEPLQWAVELGVELLIEPHGQVTDTIDGMTAILDTLGYKDNLGVCLDTGNSWLGGAEPLDFIKTFGRRIKHVHWKDMDASWQNKRGTVFGCGMANIPLGDGVVGIEEIVRELNKIDFNGYTTLEVAGADNIKLSVERIRQWSQ